MAIEKGNLVRWIDDRGFGFIKPENGKNEIFIHISALKGMSRKPVIGDTILYELNIDTNGKLNAIIEDVSQSLTLTPLAKPSKTAHPPPTKERPHRNNTPRVGRPKNDLNLSPILIIALGIFIYSKVPKKNIDIAQIKAPTVEVQSTTQTEQFQCKGKVWCTEMNSSEEALFYLHNCPGTKMDGEGDGDPCEQQF